MQLTIYLYPNYLLPMRKTFLLNFTFTIVILFIGLVSCKDSDKDNNNDAVLNRGEITLTESDINRLDYTDFALSDLSQKATKDWLKFQELQNEIGILKKGDTSFFKEDDQIISSFISDLKNEIPETLKLSQIDARLVVIETVIMQLKELSTYTQTEKPQLLEAVKKVLVANSNLVLQLNKKFEKDAQNIIKPN